MYLTNHTNVVELQREIAKSAIPVEYFNAPLSIIEFLKENKKSARILWTRNQPALHVIFTKIEHIMGHKTSISKFKRIQNYRKYIL